MGSAQLIKINIPCQYLLKHVIIVALHPFNVIYIQHGENKLLFTSTSIYKKTQQKKLKEQEDKYTNMKNKIKSKNRAGK